MLMALAVLCWLLALVLGLALTAAYWWWFAVAGAALALMHLLPPRKLPPVGSGGARR